MFKLRRGQSAAEAFAEGGRLSGGFWLDPGCSGEARRHGILIDGQALAEIDFGQSSLRILYGITGATAHLPEGDLYAGITTQDGEQAREAVKRFIGALMNIAAGDWERLAKLKGLAESILGRGLEDERQALRGAISAVHRKHAAIAEHLPSEIGRKVQKIEADIVVQSLWRLGHRGIVGLPVHDAILVRADHADVAAEVMGQVFHEISGTTAALKVTVADCESCDD
jgi:hypothetical protein